MHYLGGKNRTKKEIAEFINTKNNSLPYWEPFVGGAWVLSEVSKTRGTPLYASDANPSLIRMYNKLQGGWRPPEEVTEEEYQMYKSGKGTFELAAFVGIGCSFGGKWFGGYARDKKGVSDAALYAGRAARSLDNKMRLLKEVDFFCSDFMMGYAPEHECVIYCDPPYRGVTSYDAFTYNFDHDAFWEQVRTHHHNGHVVIVSEYSAPDDFECALEIEMKLALQTSDRNRVERLFMKA